MNVNITQNNRQGKCNECGMYIPMETAVQAVQSEMPDRVQSQDATSGMFRTCLVFV